MNFEIRHLPFVARASVLIALLVGLWFAPCQAQDTLKLSLPQAETLFLQRNLALLAQKYSISLAEAGVVQARLFPNPQATFEYNLYNPGTKKFFPKNTSTEPGVYNGGQYIFNLQQMVQLAGKRSKLVNLAVADQRLASYQFADLLRNLRLVLRSTYANLYYGQRQLGVYQQELQRLDQLLAASRISEQRGILSTYEVTRLEAERQDLASNIAGLQADIASQISVFKTLLADLTNVIVLPAEAPLQRTIASNPTLRDSALVRRPDYLYAQALVSRAELNLKYQKSLGVPDLVFGYNRESLGNAFTNYNGLNVGLQLPFFSRNQGQIQAAKVGQKVAENVQTQAQATIFADVDNALRSLQAYQNQAQFVTPDYLNRLSQLSTQADRAYRNRTISLLDYLDKFRTYKTGTVNQLDLLKNLFVSTETLATAIALP